MATTSKKVTPEEKLLHIIENTQEADKPDTKEPAKDTRRDRGAFRKMTLRTVNKALIGVSVIVTLLFIFYSVRKEGNLRARFENLKEKGILKKPIELSLEQKDIPDMAAYLDATAKNNPFHILPSAEEARPEPVAESVRDLKLVGILWLDRAQAIIEDEASNRTYVVYEGDTVGRYKITEITQNEVKLSSQDGDRILR